MYVDDDMNIMNEQINTYAYIHVYVYIHVYTCTILSKTWEFMLKLYVYENKIFLIKQFRFW